SRTASRGDAKNASSSRESVSTALASIGVSDENASWCAVSRSHGAGVSQAWPAGAQSSSDDSHDDSALGAGAAADASGAGAGGHSAAAGAEAGIGRGGAATGEGEADASAANGAPAGPATPGAASAVPVAWAAAPWFHPAWASA